MGIQTSFHADQGEFLGLRLSRRGIVEIVYDNGPAQRQIWRIASDARLSAAQEENLSDVLRIAAASPRVLPTLHQEMKKRAITLESPMI